MNNEETLLDAQGAQSEKKQETVHNPVQEEEKNDVIAAPKKGGKNTLKGAAIGAVGAAGLGAAAFSLMAFKDPDEPVANPTPGQPQPVLEPVGFDGANVPMAGNVTDDMSFSQAFAAAREEVGPGGVFQWHGNTYGTYYANEWQALSPEYQQAFSNYPYVFEIDPEETPLVVVPNEVVEHEYFGHLQIFTDENGNQFILIPDLAGNEIRINPEHLQYVILDYDGSIVGITHEGALYYESDENLWDIDIIEDEVAVLEPSEEIDDDMIIVADDSDAIVIDSEDGIEIVVDSDDSIQIDDVIDHNISDIDMMDNDMMADFNNDADISNFA
jgi:hypothetical protein